MCPGVAGEESAADRQRWRPPLGLNPLWAGGVRDFGWKGDLLPTLAEGWDTLQGWLSPMLPASAARATLTITLLGGLAALVARGARVARAAAPRAFRLLAASRLSAACYGALVTFSRLFADGAIPFDNRIASPLFLLATLAVVTALAAQWRTAAERSRGDDHGRPAVVCRVERGHAT